MLVTTRDATRVELEMGVRPKPNSEDEVHVVADPAGGEDIDGEMERSGIRIRPEDMGTAPDAEGWSLLIWLLGRGAGEMSSAPPSMLSAYSRPVHSGVGQYGKFTRIGTCL